MTTLTKSMTSAVGVAALSLVGAGAACGVVGIRINTSKSIPPGLYRTTDLPITTGSYVLVCPPDTLPFKHARERGYIGAGFCPGNYGYLMKRVAATRDDAVTITDEGVRINGALLPLTAPRRNDRAGRPLPQYRISDYLLGHDEVLLMSDQSDTGFDSRYFGPVLRSQLATAMIAVLTW